MLRKKQIKILMDRYKVIIWKSHQCIHAHCFESLWNCKQKKLFHEFRLARVARSSSHCDFHYNRWQSTIVHVLITFLGSTRKRDVILRIFTSFSSRFLFLFGPPFSSLESPPKDKGLFLYCLPQGLFQCKGYLSFNSLLLSNCEHKVV